MYNTMFDCFDRCCPFYILILDFVSDSLPTPNIGTYNATMTLCALEEGGAGQTGVNEVYLQLVGASHLVSDSGADRALLPNNETFKILLAVNSKVDNEFSFEQAKSWLDKIKEISNTICDKPLVPDADIYSAALSMLCKESDVHTTDSFLKYGKQFDGGFNDACSNTEATDVTNWLLHAEERGVQPNVEIYEAVIQSWIKTGTKEGLLTAEGMLDVF